MKVNGESVHGTTASPLGEVPCGRCTAKPGKLYLHVFDWPASGKLEVPGVKDQVTRAYLLADKKRAKFAVARRDGDGVVLTVPQEAPDKINTVVVLEVKNK
jgi:alpha-L-fucosidase